FFSWLKMMCRRRHVVAAIYCLSSSRVLTPNSPITGRSIGRLLVGDDFVTFLKPQPNPKEDPMTKLNSKLLGGAGFALMALAVAAPAKAQPVPLHSGGGPLAEKVYRDIFNCYGDSGAADTGGLTELEESLQGQATGCNGIAAKNPDVQILY